MVSQNEEEMTERGKKIMAVKQEIGGQRRNLPKFVDMNIWVGGKFEWSNYKTTYVGGSMLMKPEVAVSDLTPGNLREFVMQAQKLCGLREHGNFGMWFRMHGRNLTNGRREIEVDADVVGFLESLDANDRLILYVVDVVVPKVAPKLPLSMLKSKNPSFKPSFQPRRPLTQSSQTAQSAQSMLGSHLRPIAAQKTQPNQSREPSALNTKVHEKIQKHKKPVTSPTRTSPRMAEVIYVGSSEGPKIISTSQKTNSKHNTSKQTQTLHSPVKTLSSETLEPLSKTLTSEPSPSKTTPRRKHVARKGKGVKNKGKEKVTEKEQKRKTGKRKAEQLCEDGEERSGSHWSSDSDFSDLDVDFHPDEEDCREDLIEELTYKPSKGASEKQPTWMEDKFEFEAVQEIDYDSDDLRSLEGSDEEVDPYPRFNSETDFSHPIIATTSLNHPRK